MLLPHDRERHFPPPREGSGRPGLPDTLQVNDQPRPCSLRMRGQLLPRKGRQPGWNQLGSGSEAFLLLSSPSPLLRKDWGPWRQICTEDWTWAGTNPSSGPFAGSPAATLNQASDTTNPNRNPSSLLLCIHGDFFKKHCVKILYIWGFPGGPMAESPPANAGDTGSIPAPGRPHTPPGSWVWAAQHSACEPSSPFPAATGAPAMRRPGAAAAWQPRSLQREKAPTAAEPARPRVNLLKILHI